jgi:hypothetical protein
MTGALGFVLVIYALSASLYGAVHWRVMRAAASIPPSVRLAIGIRERLVVPAGLVSAAGALLALAQGCHLALVALVVAAALSALLDGAIAGALVVAGGSQAPAIARTHRLADAGSRVEQGAAILRRLEDARRGAEARNHRHHAEA